jgi:hypothetical protein
MAPSQFQSASSPPLRSTCAQKRSITSELGWDIAVLVTTGRVWVGAGMHRSALVSSVISSSLLGVNSHQKSRTFNGPKKVRASRQIDE